MSVCGLFWARCMRLMFGRYQFRRFVFEARLIYVRNCQEPCNRQLKQQQQKFNHFTTCTMFIEYISFLKMYHQFNRLLILYPHYVTQRKAIHIWKIIAH